MGLTSSRKRSRKATLESSALHDMDQHPRNYSPIQRLHSPQISGRFIAKVGRCIPSPLQLARNSYLRRTLPDITSSNGLAANAGQAGSSGVVMGKDWQVLHFRATTAKYIKPFEKNVELAEKSRILGQSFLAILRITTTRPCSMKAGFEFSDRF